MVRYNRSKKRGGTPKNDTFYNAAPFLTGEDNIPLGAYNILAYDPPPLTSNVISVRGHMKTKASKNAVQTHSLFSNFRKILGFLVVGGLMLCAGDTVAREIGFSKAPNFTARDIAHMRDISHPQYFRSGYNRVDLPDWGPIRYNYFHMGETSGLSDLYRRSTIQHASKRVDEAHDGDMCMNITDEEIDALLSQSAITQNASIVSLANASKTKSTAGVNVRKLLRRGRLFSRTLGAQVTNIVSEMALAKDNLAVCRSAMPLTPDSVVTHYFADIALLLDGAAIEAEEKIRTSTVTNSFSANNPLFPSCGITGTTNHPLGPQYADRENELYGEVNIDFLPQHVVGILLVNPYSSPENAGEIWDEATKLIMASKAVRKALPELYQASLRIYVKDGADLVRIRNKSQYMKMATG